MLGSDAQVVQQERVVEEQAVALAKPQPEEQADEQVLDSDFDYKHYTTFHQRECLL